MKFLIMLFLLFAGHFIQAQTNIHKGVIITEVMADPSPQVLLPPAEYLELHNTSTDTINLQHWLIQVGNNSTTIKHHWPFNPGGFVILCSPGMVQLFDTSVHAIGLSGFPSLDNDGALLQLMAPNGQIAHAIPYNKSWYQSPAKMNGGWSLELIDASRPCLTASNWKASTDPSGGTPGKVNAVTSVVTDDQPPRLVRAFCRDSLTVLAQFDESLDTISASQVMSYTMNNGIIIKSALPVSPLFNSVLLILLQPLQKSLEYLLQVTNINDCSGNSVGGFGKAIVGLPEAPEAADVIINEILFNPASGGSDYLEVYNRSKKIVDLRDLLLATRSATNGLQSIAPCSNEPRPFFPGDHFVFTTDALFIQQHYVVKEPDNVIELAALPSMPDNEGAVVMITIDNKVLDEVKYTEKWHFPLLNKKEGVSLERIAADAASNDPSNWTSASATAGFGTPAYRNSQSVAGNSGTGSFGIVPAVFSPDGDGSNDFAMIEFTFDRPGWMGTVTIFDMRGRPVRRLVANTTLAQSGSFRWDGLDQQQRIAAPGMYIVLLDVFNLRGQRKKYKGVIVLAKDFK